MGFKSLSNLAKNCNSNAGVSKYKLQKDCIAITYHKHPSKKNDGLSIRISNTILKKSRYLIGDRVDILIDKSNNLLLIKRIPTGGYKISYGSGAIKKTGNGVIQLTAYKGFPMPSHSLIIDNVVYSGEGILCELPKDLKYKDE